MSNQNWLVTGVNRYSDYESQQRTQTSWYAAVQYVIPGLSLT